MEGVEELFTQNVEAQNVEGERPKSTEKEKPKEEPEKKVEPVNEVTKSAESDSKSNQKTPIVKPESISEDVWQRYYKLGNTVANFVLNAFEVYGSGDFASWDRKRVDDIDSECRQVSREEDKEWRNRVSEHILVERMKEKEFFCCNSCKEFYFTYKQILCHLGSDVHFDKNTLEPLEDVIGLYYVLKSFTNISPHQLLDADIEKERHRKETNGPVDQFLLSIVNDPKADQGFYRLGPDFERSLYRKHPGIWPVDPTDNTAVVDHKTVFLATAFVVGRIQNDRGREAMVLLHNWLDYYEVEAVTFCNHCDYKTGDREGYYAHILSYTHMATLFANNQRSANNPYGFDNLTVLVGCFMKDRA